MLSEDSGKILNLEFLFTAWAFLSACSNDPVWNPRLGLSLINNATALQSSHLTNQLKPITGPVFIHRQLCAYLAPSAQAGRDWSRCGLCRWDWEETCEKKALCGRECMSSKIPWMCILSTPHNPLACFGRVWFGRVLAGSCDLHTPSSRSCDWVQASLCCSPNHPQECRLSWGEHVCNSWQCQKARGITTARWSKLNSKPPLSPSLSLTYASHTHKLGFRYCSMHTVHIMHIFCMHRIPEWIAFTYYVLYAMCNIMCNIMNSCDWFHTGNRRSSREHCIVGYSLWCSVSAHLVKYRRLFGYLGISLHSVNSSQMV